jgi:hypothetical protein
MITSDQGNWILSKAYVPEHIVSLITIISKGEAFLLSGYLFYVGDTWGILVGYPLGSEFSPETFSMIFKDVTSRCPRHSWSIIAPHLPAEILYSCVEKQSDIYYTLSFEDFDSKETLRRTAEKASSQLTIEVTRAMASEHEAITKEFIDREQPISLIREFYNAMPGYVLHSETALVLNARDFNGRLSAFYVLDLAAHDFATYVVGCHSKERYVPHASDMLFFEMVNIARESGKGYVNLGLGVNSGIRRFKEKWGGKPTIPYEFCRCQSGIAVSNTMIDALLSRL